MRKVVYILLGDLSDVIDSDVKSIIRENLALRYVGESMREKETFYDKLASKIYKALN